MIRAGKPESIGPGDISQRLQELEAKGALPHRGGRILRKPTAELCGLPHYAFRVSSPVRSYDPHRSSFEKYETDWLARQVVAFEAKLHALYESGELPIFRGVLQRVELESLLDLPCASLHSDAYPFGPSVVKFNSFLRENGHGLIWEVRVPKIRVWLEERIADGTVPRNHRGLLNRSAVFKAFGGHISTTAVTLRRSPRMRELLEEFDERLKVDQEINRYSKTKYAARAKELLDQNQIELTNGWIVSTRDLGKKLGIPFADVNRTPALRDLVAKRQEEVNRIVRTGTTVQTFKIAGVEVENRGATPFSEKHGRVFSFIEFQNQFSLKFCELLGTGFHQIAQSYAAAKGPYSGLKNFLRWISTNAATYPSLVASMACVTHVDATDFERAYLHYRAHVIRQKLDAKNSGGTKGRKHVNLHIVVALGELDVFPDISHLPKQARLKLRGDTQHRASLAEAHREESAVTSILVDSARSRGLHIARSKDAKAFTDTILQERASRANLPDDLAEAILRISEERLQFVCEAASAVFREERAKLEQGDALFASAKLSGREISQRLNFEGGRNPTRGIAVADLFPLQDPDVALTNLAVLIRDQYGRVCPDAKIELGFFARQYLKVGGAQRLQSLLLPTARMVSAAVTLYLAESGANVSVGLTLTRHPFEPSSARGFRRVVGYKDKADKPIVDDLAERHPSGIVSAVEALEVLSTRTAPIQGSSVLATFAQGGTARELNGNAFRDEFKEIVAAHASLANLKLVPSMLRPTKLLEVQLKNPRDLAIAKQIAQHEQEATLLGYVGKLPYKVIIEDHMRRFCDNVQVLIAEPVSKVAGKLGFDELKWATTLEKARRTGLGVYCSNPLDSPQPDVRKGEACLALDRCIVCQRRLVIADTDSIADMVVWRESLQRSEPLWLEMRLECCRALKVDQDFEVLRAEN